MGLRPADLFDLDHSLAGARLAGLERPWEILPALGALIVELAKALPGGYTEIAPGVWVGAGASIAASVLIVAPAIIGPGCELRHGAFLRGNVLMGAGCVVGNSTELKNAILFDGVQVPHFNYAGDSILGHRSHLGAGAILSNVRLDGRTVRVSTGAGLLDTGLPKLGAMVGDRVEMGCHAVANPGTIIGRESLVHPLTNVGGTVAPKSVVRRDGKVTARPL
jgi:UDP-N-acetylglucosamine diphosphorylase / glucose-1-phosphate thymidylyltransferase / UDP-N-acetylgalactosamine diphosphorylase / glucosamine-1-phosphate N-acetyltransferase / galactosamine-1-phosphate N-acetyltransferase